MGAPTKRARKTRTASEFDMKRLANEVSAPKGSTGVYAWSLADIVAARNQQMAGQFKLPARLAEIIRTDDALYTAYDNRLAPLRCIPVQMEAAKGALGEKIANEGDAQFGAEGIAIRPDTARDIHGCLVNHSVAFAYNAWMPRADGSRVDCSLRYWPIEYVRWDPFYRHFKALTTNAGEEFIVHGDGRWVVFQEGEFEPFKQAAAIMPAGLVWARHAFALRDWAQGSVSHGKAKVIGEMPLGMPLQKGGKLTEEAAAFLQLLMAIASGDAPVGIRPAGSKTEMLTNMSQAWQVWKELVNDAAGAAARIYQGTDGTLGAKGGAPGVDIAALFGVATTKVTGDVKCIERGLRTGSIEPWTAMNFGDSSLAPKRRYLLPDADGDAARASLDARLKCFFDALDRARALGLVVDQAYVDQVAKAYAIKEPPMVPPQAVNAPTLTLAATDLARIVTVNEGRKIAGLGPLVDAAGAPDPDGALTVEAYTDKMKAKNAPAGAPPAALRAV